MNQIPSTPPQVRYESDMLSIVAQNSSLGDILREVQKQTGATIEVPPNASERVVTRLGPGPTPDVLASLLNGSNFNYVMVGSPSNPTKLATLILTTKSGGAATETASVYQPQQQYTPPQVMAPGQGPGGPVAQAAANDEEADAEEQDAEDNADQDQPPGQGANGTPAAQDGTQPNAGPKTPEEILQMLRQQHPPAPGQPQIPRPNQNPPDSSNDN